MKGYTSDTIRNVALLGHGGAGKTTFLEAALLATKVINRLGKVEDGNTVSDYDKMEKEKGYSIGTSIVPVEYNKVKINFLDTPGFFDFIGEVNGALRAVEAAAIVVDAQSGIQVGTEKAWDSCKKADVFCRSFRQLPAPRRSRGRTWEAGRYRSLSNYTQSAE